MTTTPNIEPVGYVPDELPTIEESVPKRRTSSAGRVAAIGTLVILAAAAVVWFTPSLRQQLLHRPLPTRTAPARTSVADAESLPPVPVLWGRIDLGALPAEVAQDLRSGKYYYDRKLPGNFGLAISHWKQALANSGTEHQAFLNDLVTSAERELAAQFNADSGDVVVLLKQGKQAQAVILLEKMRADFLDISAPQYVWASVMLSRRRR